jgi:signal peptidase I
VSENEKKSGEQASNEAVAEATSTLKSMVMFVWDLGKVLFIAIALVFFVIRPFLLEPFVVSGKSMYPNFDDKDYLIIEKLSYRFGVPQRGDVLVFKYPLDPEQYFIKRIIGLPGEQVAVRDAVIALGMFKEGANWIWADRSMIVGIRESLVEIMQIIGRLFRDAVGKTHVEVIQLLPFALDQTHDDFKDNLNNYMKAIFASLILENILHPVQIKFKEENKSEKSDGELKIVVEQ